MSKTSQVVKESHPDWSTFSGKAEQAVVFSNFAHYMTIFKKSTKRVE